MAGYPSVLKITGESVGAAIESDARTHLAAAKDIADELGVAADTVLALNPLPWLGILETAAKLNCDAILMASHGRRGASAVLLGSETQKVLAHATQPVIVVR